MVMLLRTKILLLENVRQALTASRSLASAGYEIVVSRGRSRSFVELSRSVSGYCAYENLEKYLESQKGKPIILFPVGEISLERMALEYDRFSRFATLVMPDPETVLFCLDKMRVYPLVSELKIPFPQTAHAFNPVLWRKAASEFGFPCIVKQKSSFQLVNQEKAVTFHNADELNVFLERVKDDPTSQSLILQKKVGGFRHNCQFAAVEGRIIAYFEQKVLRTHVLDGSGFGVESVSVAPDAKIRQYCDTLLEKLNYTGVGCIQFLVDESRGEICFLEINPRLDASCALPYYCGIDFPVLAVECAKKSVGLPYNLPKTEPAYLVNRGICWYLGDVTGFWHAVRNRKVSFVEAVGWFVRMHTTLLRNRYHMTGSLRDPLPTLYLCWTGGRYLLSRILKGYSRQSRLIFTRPMG